MKTALITGITGQDGAYLASFLLKKGYRVVGGYRRLSTPNFWRLHYLDIFDKVDLVSLDVLDSRSISDSLVYSQPKEVYHLAAQSFVAASYTQPLYTGNVTGFGTVRILEEILKFNKKIKFYQASSSELYGEEGIKIKNEKSEFKPVSPYAIAKLYSYWMTRLYRKGYGLFAANGILFNHESPLRGLEFVTRKISNEVAKISLGLSNSVKLGNLNAQRDWGYAPEFVEGMWMMLQQKTPDDFVLATNEIHSVEEFAKEACKIAGVSQTKIKTDKRFLRPLDVENLRGDYKKAEKKLGWKPKITFKKLVKIMVEEDLNRWQKWLKGERQSWDASMSGEYSKIIPKQ
jgi:GDPmannose 4,6-dehydratase